MFKSFPISRITKGGETMKTFVLVLALMVVAAGVSVAATATIDIYPGWNQIAAPLVPFDPDPMSAFAEAADGLDAMLYRFSPAEGGTIAYDEFDPDSFGGILLGDGFQLNVLSGDNTLTYEGVEDGVPDAQGVKTDMWISLPGEGSGNGGFHLIGQPFAHSTTVNETEGISFTDGTDVKDWATAVADGWVSDIFLGLDPSVGGSFSVSLDGFGDTDSLEAGHGYWINTFVDNLAMIVSAEE